MGSPPGAAVTPALKRLARLGLLAALAVAVAACVPGEGDDQRRDTVRFPLPTDISGLEFSRVSDSVTRTVLELLSDPLVAFDQQLEIVPAAASSWTWSDDRLRLTFRLREGLRWHDGEPVTSADVVHTWKRETDPLTADPGRAAGFNLVASLETPNERTVVVHYRRPYSPALSAWSTIPLLPAHRAADPDPPIGCGRWRFERWDPGERVVLRSNDGHPDGPAGVRLLELEVVPDYSTRLAALEAGRVQFTTLVPRAWRSLEQDESFRERFDVRAYRVLYYWYIAWRMDGSNPLFADARVRRALTLAIDRGGYLDALGDSPERLPVTTFHPDSWAFDGALEPWPHDPQRARELLDEAGWRERPDGTRARGGQPLRFVLSYAQTSAENEKIAAFVQDGLRRVGVHAELEPLEYAVLLERLAQRDFEALMSGMRLDPDPDPFDLWHSSQRDAGQNYPGLADPELDGWIESAREEFDRAERARLYRLVQRRLHELEPLTIFFYPTSRVAVDRRLAGVAVGPLGPLRGRPGPAAWRWRAGTP